MRIYTKTGDTGETGLLGGKRVGKDDLRVAAYGDVDELNAVLGLARAASGDAVVRALLRRLQRELLALGAQLADPSSRVGSRKAKAVIGAREIRNLEKAIDARQGRLPKLTAFLLPGGSPPGALLHLARTVCRRAERAIVALHRREKLDPRILVYVNRLSDLLFVLAREANQQSGEQEDRW
jgi:cob(I)alamin adenosyltransferase